MANEIRIKRRVTGVAGSPTTLLGAELAHNEVDNTLYVGVGDNGSGVATSIVAIGGSGAFVDLSTTQTIGGAKTFSVVPKSSQDASIGTHLVRKSQMDTLLGAKAALASPALTGTPSAPTAAGGTNTTQLATTAFVQSAVGAVTISTLGGIGDVSLTSPAAGNLLVRTSSGWVNKTLAGAGVAAASHTHPISAITSLQATLNAKAALASPALTGVPTAPTAGAGTNTTQVANAAFVQQELAALVAASPAALNTLNELALAIGNDPNFATTMTNNLAGKATKASNLSDLASIPSARSNLGLGSLALQAANAVNISGGAISGIVLDGGTF